MPGEKDALIGSEHWSEIAKRIHARTPARLLAGRAGAAYRTSTQLDLREAHAAARDAVRAELNDLASTFCEDFVQRWGLFEVGTQAASKNEFLLRPDLGRSFNNAGRAELQRRCPPGRDFQIAIGDGLSVPAIAAQVPSLLPVLDAGARDRGWTVGQTFVIRHCRVGILNNIGELLHPKIAVLLIGERPGLATAESLSAYMAYHPAPGHTDANRNLVSNIHARGATPEEAAVRILNLAEKMMQAGAGGYSIREGPDTLLGEHARSVI